jgi:hypothetical protein
MSVKQLIQMNHQNFPLHFFTYFATSKSDLHIYDCRAVGTERSCRGEGTIALPDFGKSVNLIPTDGGGGQIMPTTSLLPPPTLSLIEVVQVMVNTDEMSVCFFAKYVFLNPI